jgi:YD repeat-containing protein
LSWWQKQGQNNWQYVEQIVSANTAIGGNGLLIDEVRLLPQHADMTTYSYDNRGNKISECDANNNCMHYEYDEFNRVKTIRDSKRNILEHKVYQLD